MIGGEAVATVSWAFVLVKYHSPGRRCISLIEKYMLGQTGSLRTAADMPVHSSDLLSGYGGTGGTLILGSAKLHANDDRGPEI